jgi:hypothetical protein
MTFHEIVHDGRLVPGIQAFLDDHTTDISGTAGH